MTREIAEMVSKMRGFIERLRELEVFGPFSERDEELLGGLKKLVANYMTDVRVSIIGNCQMCCAPIEFNFSKIDRKLPGGSYGDDKSIKCQSCSATNIAGLTMHLVTSEDGDVIERVGAKIRLRY